MGTITRTLTIEPAWNKQKKDYEKNPCTRNIRTINKIRNLRNQKKIGKDLGTKIKDLGNWDTVLRIGTKIVTLSKLQVRNKNERTRN